MTFCHFRDETAESKPCRGGLTEPLQLPPGIRAAVGMGIPMGIPMGMGMVWVWGL